MSKDRNASDPEIWRGGYPVSESDITTFCSGCDNLTSNNICRVKDAPHQAIIVYAGLCVAAQKDGTSGSMYINKGFTPFPKRG